MDVDAAVARRGEGVSRQDQTVGGHDQYIEIKTCQRRLLEVRRLQNCGAGLLRENLHRTGLLSAPAAGRPVRLGEHHQRCQVVCVEVRQDGRGEIGCAGKTQAL